jgi:hypothetical protein
MLILGGLSGDTASGKESLLGKMVGAFDIHPQVQPDTESDLKIILKMILTLLFLTLILNYLLNQKSLMYLRKRLVDQADKLDHQNIFVILFCYQISSVHEFDDLILPSDDQWLKT